LNITLQSHREALNLDQDNADAFFNTAQVLTSLAEVVTDTKHPSDHQLSRAVKYLQEAIELFQRCLTIQEMRYTEMQEEIKLMQSGDIGSREEEMQAQPPVQESMEKADELKPSDQQEQWAAVVEPVTKDTLVDTAVAQLETLTTLCNLLTFNPGVGLGWVEESSADLLQEKISAYVEGSSRQYEASLARAKFTCALSEVLYRSERIEVDTYHTEIARVFGPELDLSADPDGLCSKADALTSFNTALTDLPPSHDHEVFARSLTLRWQALSAALDALTKASKLPDAENLPKIHLARGDVEMNRWRLGMSPWEYTIAQQNAATLLRNAQTYYRGAAALAKRDGSTSEERDGTCKEALTAALEGQKDKMRQLKATTFKELIIVAEDVVDDGWLSPGDMEALLSS
jgi:tetratricopeptide (TPR) repeat protein